MKITCPNCKRRLTVKRGNDRKCKCGHMVNYMHFFRGRVPFVVYLIDANVLIYAYNKDKKRGKGCQKVLKYGSPTIKIGTTDIIINEVGKNRKMKIPDSLILYRVKRISDDLKDLKTNYLKQPSEADLSLVQAALDHAEVQGIITYDKDFSRIATQGVVQRKSSTKFWLGNAQSFLNKYEIKAQIRH